MTAWTSNRGSGNWLTNHSTVPHSDRSIDIAGRLRREWSRAVLDRVHRHEWDAVAFADDDQQQRASVCLPPALRGGPFCVYRYGIDLSRRAKPSIPLRDAFGVAIAHELAFALLLRTRRWPSRPPPPPKPSGQPLR